MVLKWWSVGLIVVLGAVWFGLAEQSTAAAAARPAQGGPLVAEPRGAAGAEAALLRQEAPAPGQAPAASAPAAPRATDPAQAGKVGELVAQAASLKASGDVAGAAAALRQAIQQAGTAAEAARAGQFLAPLTADLLERRQLLSAALLEDVVAGEEYDEVGAQLRELNRNPGASLQPALKLESYTVVANDSLWKLCNKVFPGRYGVSPEVGLVRLVNGLQKDSLRVGQALAVPSEPVRVVVSMRQHGLTAFVGETAVAAYWIGLGKEGRTPRDTFVIATKQENPAWFNGERTIPFGDPENILGTRWMGFESKPGATGFGIHGTAHPESVGRDESMGCVRMRNPEVEELFEYVPRGARVTIG
jgi:hypothetical protein